MCCQDKICQMNEKEKHTGSHLKVLHIDNNSVSCIKAEPDFTWCAWPITITSFHIQWTTPNHSVVKTGLDWPVRTGNRWTGLLSGSIFYLDQICIWTGQTQYEPARSRSTQCDLNRFGDGNYLSSKIEVDGNQTLSRDYKGHASLLPSHVTCCVIICQ